ncbi:type II toxin-antitoxin system VapC family toxin [Thermodesulfobacteriota bacterium]
MVGLDTGFFVELMNGNEEAVALWRSAINDEVDLVVSCLSLFEIERLGVKGKLRDAQAVLEAVNGVTDVVWLNEEILSRAAGLTHGVGLPSMDSLILASLLSRDVGDIYTTDAHFESYQSSRVSIRNLRRRV